MIRSLPQAMKTLLTMPILFLLAHPGGTPLFGQDSSSPGELIEKGRLHFQAYCAGCHGGDGTGGDRGPDIIRRQYQVGRSPEALSELIRTGRPEAGMPGFSMSDQQRGELVAFLRSRISPALENPSAGDVEAGRAWFSGSGQCLSCHLVGGLGGVSGPDLTNLAAQRTAAEIEEALLEPGKTLTPGYASALVELQDGRRLQGVVRNESDFDLQLQSEDGSFSLLGREEIRSIRRSPSSPMPKVTLPAPEFRNLMAFLTRLSEQDPGAGLKPATAGPQGGPDFKEIRLPREGSWPTYNGRLEGNRHSPLREINTENVSRLAPVWSFPVRTPRPLEVTPVVWDGIMYVTAVNQVHALDARSGRPIWSYQRPRREGQVGDAGSGINRGVAILGDRVFLATDDAHLIALHRVTGGLIWEVEMADWRSHYGATSAPLVVKDLVVSGVSGGDEGIRGFLAAYEAATGRPVWRFWTVPAPGEPLSETWVGNALEHGCAATWLTGSYDPDSDLLYWPTGNPCPDFNGDQRQGDNLYSNSVLALEPDTGRLRWHYQFTPHDLHDWDATEPLLLIDAEFRGRPRKLLAQANRNGFFYVLDRLTGELLLAEPFVEKLTWATGIGRDGRPQVRADRVPTHAGVRVCPAVEGATNWMSTAYHPDTGLFYVMALEECNIYTKSNQEWTPGESFYGGTARAVPGEPGRKFLRALDLETGKIVWEYAQTGPATTWSGVLSTAGNLLFLGDDSGSLAALDARSGRALWKMHFNVLWKASPMTYSAAGEQYVAIAAGESVVAFRLVR